MGDRSSPHTCSTCGTASAVGELRCAACGAVWVHEAVVEATRQRSLDLVESLRGDPYLRSASLLAYTLRSHVRGFLDDPAHPLARALLLHLHALAVDGGAAALRQLAPHAEREWVAPASPVLARAVRYVRERFAEQLAVVAHSGAERADFEAWYRELLERD